MNKLSKYYRLLLGLDAAWEVSDVSLLLEENRVEISLTHLGGPVFLAHFGVAGWPSSRWERSLFRYL